MPMILDKNFSRTEKEQWIKKVVLTVANEAWDAAREDARKLGYINNNLYANIDEWLVTVTEDAITDEILKEEWDKLGDIPINDDEQIDEDYTVGQGRKWQTSWPKGTDREDIWRWFDMKHSIGVYKLATND